MRRGFQTTHSLFRQSILPTAVICSASYMTQKYVHAESTYRDMLNDNLEEKRRKEEHRKWQIELYQKQKEDKKRERNLKEKEFMKEEAEKFPIRSYRELDKTIPEWFSQINEMLLNGDFNHELRRIESNIVGGGSLATEHKVISLYPGNKTKWYPEGIDYDAFKNYLWWNSLEKKITIKNNKLDGCTLKLKLVKETNYNMTCEYIAVVLSLK